jgi:hypothetical protein
MIEMITRLPFPGNSVLRARSGGMLQRLDVLLAVALYLAAFALYAPLGLRLAHGRYLDYYNLAFDFDPYRTLKTLALSPPDPQGFKHPLILLLRAPAWLLVQLGVAPKPAAVLEMVAFGSGTVVLCFLFLRLATVGRTEALALTALFALSCTQIFTSLITESYGFSGFAITLVWLIAMVRLRDPNRLRRLRVLAAVMALGVTVTNVLQPVLAELLVAWRQRGLVQAIRQVMLFGMVVGVIAGLLGVAIWFRDFWAAAHHPVLALKEIWWQQTKGPRADILAELKAFFGFSFVAPRYSWLMLPEGTNMRDFRQWTYALTGSVAALGWLAFWVVGTVAGLRHHRYRWIALGLLAATVFNLLFHMHFQFRGSLFIYAAHLHFTIFALGAGLAPWLAGRSRRQRGNYVCVVLALAALVGANNLPIAAGFVSGFDHVDTPCPAPCADGLG